MIPAVPPRVFISHASADATLALNICNGLESRGVRCWIAPRDVQSDGTYGTEIMKGLRECEVFLIILSDAASESQQVEREAERASHYKKRIIPLTLGQTDPGPRLEYYIAGRQRFPCPSPPSARFFDSLADAARGETVAHETPAPPRSRRQWLLPSVAAGLALAITAGYLINRPTPINRSAPPAAAPTTTQPPPIAPVNLPTGADSNKSDGAARQPTPGRASNPPPSPATVTKDKPAPAAAVVPAARSGGVEPAVVNGVRMAFVSIPGGTFKMGCSAGDGECGDDEKPVRNVAVEPFQMSATEVTQAVWQSLMKNNPSDFTGATLPVEHVSWQDAQAFVDQLNQRRDGFIYRLPTEAEWEYAARAQEPVLPELNAVAWFGMASGSARAPRPQSVGTKKANRWGLYDMLGNVAEWCEDWYSPNFQRVVRGGSWMDSASALRVSARGKAVPSTRDYSIGLRLIRTPQ